jgi:hypothetical protein
MGSIHREIAAGPKAVPDAPASPATIPAYVSDTVSVASAVQPLINSGLKALSKRAAGYLYRRTVRKLLPTIAEVKYSGIPISRERKFGDSKLPDFLVPYPLEDIVDYEQTLVSALHSQVRIGDRVTIVGGGEGVTAVVAAKAVGQTGSVVCFEGNSWNARKVKATAARNKMSNRLTVKHAIVGDAIAVYGVPHQLSTLVVSPAELPECDVLQLDCEGAELMILRNMAIRPRVIAVETHGVYGAPTRMVKELLEKLEYAVEECGLAEPRVSEECEANDIRILVGKRNQAEYAS